MSISPKKLIFGTANLFSKYGQKSTYINYNDSLNLINYAYRNKIRTLDISNEYTVFKKNLTKFNFGKWGISLKLTKKVFSKINSKKKSDQFIKLILKKFNCKKIEYVLFHHENDLFTKEGRLFFKFLIFLKKKKIINKIGVSIYDFKKLFSLLESFPVDVVQVPFNVLDQRLKKKNVINLLKKKKIEIHVRSIFLQGILVNKKLIPRQFTKNKIINSWFNFMFKKSLNPLKETFNFLNKNKIINKIVIGVRNKKQVEEILSSLNYSSSTTYSYFDCKNNKIIDPRKW